MDLRELVRGNSTLEVEAVDILGDDVLELALPHQLRQRHVRPRGMRRVEIPAVVWHVKVLH